MNQHITAAPEHVPADLVVSFDQLNGPEILAFPPTAAKRVANGRPIFYSNYYGGYWVVANYEYAREVYQNAELFQQWPNGVPFNPFSKLFKPLYLNPPEHGKWRKVLTPLFSPRALQKQEDFIRGIAREQVALLAPRGKAELVQDYAEIIPSRMFGFFLGLPMERFEEFAQMGFDLIFGPAQAIKNGATAEQAKAVRAKANAEIDEFIARLIPERRKNPGDDLVSILLAGEVDGQPLSEEDVINMTTLLFFAGTDTTRAVLTFAFMHLANHHELRDRLVNDPAIVKNASEELIRLHGFHLSARQLTEDVEFHGVQMKKGELVLLSTGAAGRDENKFPDAETADFDRRNAHSHLTFGAGIHRCIGSHSGTLQLRIALEEFHKVIKDYHNDPDGQPTRFVGGQGKVIPENLDLAWTPVR
ncbi:MULTISPECIES: cytochrome P450 [Paracoccus]|uniref:cytochrome P450 n=1 Tax=Paracoccus TaxID=265 RepID=UPI0006855C07|nr:MULTISPECIES: cytochrome P450 [Paracoccus]